MARPQPRLQFSRNRRAVEGAVKVLWHKPVGDGHSSPVVAGGKVFLHTKVADKDQEQISAYDAKTGEILWHTAYDRASFFSVFGVGPQATPAVADGRVYTYGVTGLLACFDAADGKEVWRIDALKELKAKNLFFGAACSPLVDGDKVYVAVGGPALWLPHLRRIRARWHGRASTLPPATRRRFSSAKIRIANWCF